MDEALQTNFFSLFPHREERNEFLRLLGENEKIEFFEHGFMKRHGGDEITVLENVVGFFSPTGSLE